ncbi:MAG TPA: response regulator [Myxococcota bacterium]|jgi:CheY-like chemotaxis protein
MRVLVVDDDADFLHLARRALEARGHEVEATTSAFGIVNKVAGANAGSPGIARSPGPDLVVLDCEMPGLSGFAVIELLAKDRRTAQVPVLLVSAGDGEQQRAARAMHPLAHFHRKDGRMKGFVDDVEEHHRAVISEVARVKT